MKLELKHLAPYLPYKLNAKNCFNDIVEIKGLQLGSESVNNELWIFKKDGNYLKGYLYQCKPIFRPMSDLPDDIFNDFGFADEEYFFICLREGKLNYCDIVKLISQHFDVFGLIDAGLAIDINTVPELLNG